jgi:hypothetical protein
MQITIDIPDQIVDIATKHGQTPEEYVTQLVHDDVAKTAMQERADRFHRNYPMEDLELATSPDSADKP